MLMSIGKRSAWCLAGLLLTLLATLLSGCSGDGSSPSTPPPPPTTVTDTSGDFAITVNSDSPTQLTVTWEDPTAAYTAQPSYRYSRVYRNGVAIVPSTSGFSLIDTGLQPDTFYCYRVEVIAYYQFLWTSYSVGWSSGTACIATRYGLRVVTTSPVAGEVSIPTDSAISVTFNGAIDPASVTPASFTMTDASGEVAGSITAEGNIIRFKPLTPLTWGTSYTVTVGTGVRDITGYALSTPYSWTFTERMSTACLSGIWGSSATDVFAVGGDGAVLHFNGGAWSLIRTADGQGLSAVWGSAPNNVYAVGGGRILHYNGGAWPEVWSAGGTPVSLSALWGSSGSDVFAVGADGIILHFDGTTWSAMSSGTTTTLTSVWGAAANDVFTVGSGGTILHYDGNAWTPMSSGVGTDLFTVWGFASTDVLAAGRNFTEPNVLYYDGSAWSADPIGQNNMAALWGFTGGSVYAASMDDVLVRVPNSGYPSGYAWVPVYSGAEGSDYLNSIWGTSASDLYAAGCGGTIMHYDGVSWSQALP